MLSGNGTIDHSVEAHTLDAQETSTARQGSTTRNIHGSITKNFHLDRKFYIIIYPLWGFVIVRLNSRTSCLRPNEIRMKQIVFIKLSTFNVPCATCFQLPRLSGDDLGTEYGSRCSLTFLAINDRECSKSIVHSKTSCDPLVFQTYISPI